jgi:L-alanine-DL-glutamate epimerase-like enolase superfamily enzyme
MLRSLTAHRDTFPLSQPFRISRGVKTVAEVVTVEISAHGKMGRGEGVPYARYGESIESALVEIEAARSAVEQGASRDVLLSLMRAGAARNAVDCALWDLESQIEGRSVVDRLGVPALSPTPTAMTVSLDTPEKMAAAAATLAEVPLIKVKVDQLDPKAQIAAVRSAAPTPRLIVDPNESWTMDDVVGLQDFLVDQRVDLLEQPVAAESDDVLSGFQHKIPMAADESAHVAGDVAALSKKYQYINIKLDKTGGLTAALQLADAAEAAGMGLMTGCMVSTSLSINPALIVAARCSFVDLDGPLWLAEDRNSGLIGRNGILHLPEQSLWGLI